MTSARPRRILLRCDANPQLGIGHVARCQALAAALYARGAECIVVGPGREYQTSTAVREWIPHPFGGFEAKAKAEAEAEAEADADATLADAESLAAIAKHHQADWLVLDDYRVNEAYQRVLRKHACRWLQFDGASTQTLWADLVLNSSPAARAENYQKRLGNPATQLLLGPRYAILRSEFAAPNCSGEAASPNDRPAPNDQPAPNDPASPQRLDRAGDTPIRVYLNFGGGDDRGALRWCAQTLLEAFPRPLHLKLVSGQQNPHNETLGLWASRQGHQLEFLVNPPNLAVHLRACDLAILSGGMSCYEADSCGLSMLLVPLVPNQVAHARAWAEHGRAHLLEGWPDVSPSALRAALTQCVAEWEGIQQRPQLTDGLGPRQRPQLTDGLGARQRRQLTDGLGAQRVAELLLA